MHAHELFVSDPPLNHRFKPRSYPPPPATVFSATAVHVAADFAEDKSDLLTVLLDVVMNIPKTHS